MAIPQQTKPASRAPATGGMRVNPQAKPTSGRPTPNAGGAVVGNSGGMPFDPNAGKGPTGAGGIQIHTPPGTPPQVAALANNPTFQQHVLQGKNPAQFSGHVSQTGPAGTGPGIDNMGRYDGTKPTMAGGPRVAPDQQGYGGGGPMDPTSKPMPMGPSQGGVQPAGTPFTPWNNQGGNDPGIMAQPPAGDTTGQGLTPGMGDQYNPQQAQGLFQDPAVLQQVRQNLQMARPGGAGGPMRPQGWVPGQAY